MKPSPDAAAGVPFPPDGDRASAAPSFPGSPGRRLSGDPAMPPQTPLPHAQQAPAQPDHTARIDDEGLSDETRPVPRDRGPVAPGVPAPATAADTPVTPATGAGGEAPTGATPEQAVEDGETQDIRFAPGEAPGQLPPSAADADEHIGVLPPGPADTPDDERPPGTAAG